MTTTLRAHVAMLIFSIMVAGSFALLGIVATDISPISLNALRFTMAAAIMGTVAYATGNAGREVWRAPWRYLVQGAIFAIYFVLMFEGLKTAPPVSAAAVFTLMPFMTALIAYFFFGQAFGKRLALALGIGAIGALWVVFRADIGNLLALDVGRGEAIYFVGCVAHAFLPIMMKRLNRGESAVFSSFGALASGGLILGIVGFSDIIATPWTSLPALVWWVIGYITVFASAVSFLMLQYASKHLPSANVMAYSYLTPSWVILWQIALGRGLLPSIVLIGVGLSFLSVLLLLRDDQRG
jgi:drug/metabolite transporter (DMT)-like permease